MLTKVKRGMEIEARAKISEPRYKTIIDVLENSPVEESHVKDIYFESTPNYNLRIRAWENAMVLESNSKFEQLDGVVFKISDGKRCSFQGTLNECHNYLSGRETLFILEKWGRTYKLLDSNISLEKIVTNGNIDYWVEIEFTKYSTDSFHKIIELLGLNKGDFIAVSLSQSYLIMKRIYKR